MRNTEHMQAKNKIRKITVKTQFEEILEQAMLSEQEKELMRLYYIEKKSFAHIADGLGFSESGVIKKHKKILKIIANLI